YYHNYLLQNNSTYNATEESNVILAMVVTSMITSKSSDSAIDGYLKSAKNNISLTMVYDQEMLKNARTESQKNYAQVLILQTRAMIKYIGLLGELNVSSQNNPGENDKIMKQLDELRNQTKDYQNELDSIKNNDPELKKRINEENKKLN
ncbi:MAG TPA: hypothetical protein VLR54_05475, partial [Methanobacteriaceae archaeon]|nr:hypothetical protein [Methanobacteriaceae archaeon]